MYLNGLFKIYIHWIGRNSHPLSSIWNITRSPKLLKVRRFSNLTKYAITATILLIFLRKLFKLNYFHRVLPDGSKVTVYRIPFFSNGLFKGVQNFPHGQMIKYMYFEDRTDPLKLTKTITKTSDVIQERIAINPRIDDARGLTNGYKLILHFGPGLKYIQESDHQPDGTMMRRKFILDDYKFRETWFFETCNFSILNSGDGQVVHEEKDKVTGLKKSIIYDVDSGSKLETRRGDDGISTQFRFDKNDRFTYKASFKRDNSLIESYAIDL